MKKKAIKLLKSLVWEKYFRHKGVEQEKWKYKDCENLQERLQNKEIPYSVSARTLYNFSIRNQASDHTLSALVFAVYNDNKAFTDYFNIEYQGNNKRRWEAFTDFISWQTGEMKELLKNKPETNKRQPAVRNPFDPLLFIFAKAKAKPILIFIFFFFIYWVVIVSLAILTGVWKGIDYPLSQSYSVWAGYPFFAVAATFFTLYNKHLTDLLSYANGKGEKLRKRLFSSRKLYLIIPAVLIAGLLHYSYLTDPYHGWCESAVGKISFLGVYHLLLYAFNLLIIFLFIFYYVHTGKIVHAIAETDTNNQTGFDNNEKAIISTISKLNIYYKIIVLIFGIFSILFFSTTILFMKNHSDYSLHTWQWFEVFILVIFYFVFGFILYWFYFAKNMSNFLIAVRNRQLLQNSFNRHEMVYTITLPTSPDEIAKHKTSVLNILIWMVSIVILLLLGGLMYLSG